MKEVVTLQFGSYANFVGTHFWNFQDELLGRSEEASGSVRHEKESWPDELDSNVLFRVGETHQGAATYTPRLVAFDLRGSAGAVPSTGTLYSAPPQAVDESIINTWGGQRAVYRSERLEKNAFLKSLDDEEERDTGAEAMEMDDEEKRREADLQKVAGLESNVRYWTDYLKVHLHPKSLYELSDTWQGMTDLSTYGEGVAVLAREETREEMEERVRFFAEEADHLQGFQCIVDESGGFAAISSGLLTTLSDEYPRLPRLTFAVRPPTDPRPASSLRPAMSADNPLSRALHDSVSLATLTEASSLYVPAGPFSGLSPNLFPHLLLQTLTIFRSSAIHAAAFDAFTSPYRFYPRGALSFAAEDQPLGALEMHDLVRLLANTERRKIAEVALSFPAPGVKSAAHKDRDLVRSLVILTDEEGPQTVGSSFAESLVFRGARSADASRAVPPKVAEDALRESLQASGSGRAVRHLAATKTPLPIPLPFPNIFSAEVGRHGDVSTAKASQTAKGGVDVESVPFLSRLAVTPRLAPMLRSRLEGLERFGGFGRPNEGARVLEGWGMGQEEATDMRDKLRDMVREYEGDLEGSDEHLSDEE